MKNHYIQVLIFLILLNAKTAFSQVVINEISASNYSDIKGPDGNYNDWIELYNAGSTIVDLTGYGITDDPSDPYKFKIKSGKIGPGEYQILFATGNDFPYKPNHWEMVIDEEDDWRYYSSSGAPDTNWRNLSFNETVWQRNQGGFGFGDGDDHTTISQTKAVFLRRTFTVADPGEVLCAVLNVDYDDGFVAYLNGVEIARNNVGSPGTRPANDIYANGSHEAKMFNGGKPDYYYLNPKRIHELLQTGTNVLAVQVHNETSSSNDLSSRVFLHFGMKNSGSTYAAVHSWFDQDDYDSYETNFKLDRHGEQILLYDDGGSLADNQSYANMQTDNSAGRKPDGGGWGVFKVATPGTTNDNETLYTDYCPKPVFTHDAGFYSSNITVDISSPLSGATIRYTTDGSDPTSSSSVWNNSMNISSTKVIKARIYKTNYVAGEIVTKTFFRNLSYKLPVVTINTDPDNLFDNSTGIYQMGPNADPNSPYFGANFWQDWEKPATCEYFDKNDNQLFDFYADIKIFGNYSRAKPQKSFELKVNNNIGGGDPEYQLIPDKPMLTKFENIVLRNSGSEWNQTQFRDAFLERVMKPTHSGYLSADPVNVFINGAYWGIYQLTENHDHHFMENNYGYKENQLDYLLEGGNIEVKLGMKTDFMNLVNYATSANANTTAYYDRINRDLDIENFTDYMIAETYFNNQDWMGDWTNNIKMWRPAGGKWKYLLYDLDMCVGYSGTSTTTNSIEVARNPQSQNYTSDLFDAILDNPTFKNYFINRYADLINTIFQYDSMMTVEESFKDSMSSDMAKHFAKWGGSISGWNNDIDDMESYYSARIGKMRDIIKSEFGLAGKVTLTLNVNPAGAGKIIISTVQPKSLPWSGVYFNGNPVTITAIANPGYTFDHWHSNVAFTTNNSNITVTKNFTSTDAITAFFSGSSAAPSVVVSEINYNSDPNFDSGDWVEFHNTSSTSLDVSGWVFKDADDAHAFTIPTTTIIPGNGYLVVAADNSLFTSKFPNVTNFVGSSNVSQSNSGDEIRLFDSNGNLVVDMIYDDHSPWPTEPDGAGYTLELQSPSGNLNDGNNWFAGCMGGTPGRAYSGPNTNVTVPSNTIVCEGDTVQLTVTYNSNYTYQWLNNNVPVPGATSSTIDATVDGDYTVLVTDQGCSLISSPVTVTVTPLCGVPVVQDMSICDQGSVTINASSPQDIHWYDDQYVTTPLTTGSSFTTPVLNQSTIYYLDAGVNCPSARIPVNVFVVPSPVIFIGNDTLVTSGSFVTLDAGNGFANYLWSDGSTTQTVTVASPSNMWVTVTDSSGCSGSDSINISAPTSIADLNTSGLAIYPNPAKDKLNYSIDMGADEEVHVQLFDAQGKVVSDFSIHGHGRVKGEMNLTGYASGLYVLTFVSENHSVRTVVKIEN